MRLFLRESRVECGCFVYTRSENALGGSNQPVFASKRFHSCCVPSLSLTAPLCPGKAGAVVFWCSTGLTTEFVKIEVKQKDIHSLLP